MTRSTNALTAANGTAIVSTARSLGTAIRHRGRGESVRFARVRSSTSFAKAAAAIARTTSGTIEPAKSALNAAFSNSAMDGASVARRVSTAVINRKGGQQCHDREPPAAGELSECEPIHGAHRSALHQVAENTFKRIVQRLDPPEADPR